ncbi:unnamed protein product [Prunus armeniaca]
MYILFSKPIPIPLKLSIFFSFFSLPKTFLEPSSYAGNEDPRTRFKHQSLMQGEIWCCIFFIFYFLVVSLDLMLYSFLCVSFIRFGVFMISGLLGIRLFRVIYMSAI